MSRKGRRIKGCNNPRWTRTRRGQRCVSVCEGGLWRFVPGSVCEQRERSAVLGDPELLAVYTGSVGPQKSRAKRGKRS